MNEPLWKADPGVHPLDAAGKILVDATERNQCPEAGQFLDKTRGATLSVSFRDGAVALEHFASEIDRLNAASARPNPFMSSAFLRTYALNPEYHTPDIQIRLYLVWDDARLIGCAPLQRVSESFRLWRHLRWHSEYVGFQASFDVEQPSILSSPQDHERVARSLIRYLCDHERGWKILEMVGQPPDAVVHRALHAAAGGRFRVRDIAVAPYNEIAVEWGTLSDYFRSLAKKMRSNISRQARRLFAAGAVELIFAQGAPAVTAWFEAYCDLDSRSWKNGTTSSIQRHVGRVSFYQSVAAGTAGFEPSFIGIVLDGVLIAGLILGANTGEAPQRHGAWCLEMAYDRLRADLGPGQLLLLLAMGLAIERGHKHLNFMQNFSYYKHRWGARPIKVVNVQLIRRLSVRNAFALLAELRRTLRARAQQRDGIGEQESEDAVDAQESDSGTIAHLSQHQERAAVLTSAALAHDGHGIRRLDRAGSAAYLPFELA